MMFSSAVVVGVLFLSACASPPVSPLVEWVSFVEEVDQLNSDDLMSKHKELLKNHTSNPSDSNRLRLSYILSRSTLSAQDIAKSKKLLADIKAGSVYVPLRNMVRREIILMAELQEVHRKLDELQRQLEILKTIDGDLTESQKEIDEISQ